jgi:hypothetical protein
VIKEARHPAAPFLLEATMTINTAEKIETIVLSRSSGSFGEFIEYAPGKFRITADGRTVLVRCGTHGWHVSFKSFEAIDPELYIAARDALDAGSGVEVTRHANLGDHLAAWS